jgi:xanthine dehydrogenase molybdenum-binding subunit
MGSVGWVSGTACLNTPLDAGAAVVMVNEDGSATLVSGAADLGTGAKTTLAQIAAEELGIPIELLQVSDTDTDLTPFDAGAHASRTAYQAGNAARVAAADAREQARRFVAEQLEASVDDLELVDGEFVVRGAPEQRMPWREAAERAFMKSMQFIGRGQAPRANDAPSGAQFVEVEVDTETGVVRVVKIVAAHDVGRAINPLIVEGQIEGALQQGLGYALYEDMPIDPETGAALAVTFADYRMPTAQVMPEIEVILVEKPGPGGPFGLKGVGEPGLGPTAAAIANAIYDAVGVRIAELPITPERVLRALQEQAAAAR